MALAPALVRLIADPVDHGPLAIVGSTVLYNPRLRRAYPVADGIPVLIADRATPASDADNDRYLAASLGWTGPVAETGAPSAPAASSAAPSDAGQ